MRVKDLIEKLSEMDPEAVVINRDYDDGDSPTLPIRVVEEHNAKEYESDYGYLTDVRASEEYAGKKFKNVIYLNI